MIDQAAPHEYKRKGWRFWLCKHCMAPKSQHPRTEWTPSRVLGNNDYLSRRHPWFMSDEDRFYESLDSDFLTP